MSTLEERVEEIVREYRIIITKDGLSALLALIEAEKKESYEEGKRYSTANQKFPKYPLDRLVTREEYEAGYKMELEEYAKLNKSIRKFICNRNIALEEVTEDGKVWMRFPKPSVPETLEKYIYLQEFIRSGIVMFPHE